MTTDLKACSPMKRPGSKSRLTQRLLPHFAKVPHTCYVEPFAGTCSVLMAKPRVSGEVMNDIDGALVNAMRQIQHHPRELTAQLRWALNSRADFHLRRTQPGHTEIHRAASYLLCNNISFAGDNHSFGVAKGGGGGANTPLSRIFRQVTALHDRLERVVVEQLDWQRCLKLYDSPATLFYCDPPYVGGRQKPYASWTLVEVQALRDALSALQGRWVVTLNDSPEIRAIFKGCEFTSLHRARGLNGRNKTKKPVYRELIIAPPSPSA